jgi:hypothetical protein
MHDQLHLPAIVPSRKQQPVPIRQDAGWAPELRTSVDDMERDMLSHNRSHILTPSPSRS